MQTREEFTAEIQHLLEPMFGERFVRRMVIENADSTDEMVSITRSLLTRLVGEAAANGMIEKITANRAQHILAATPQAAAHNNH